MPFGYGNEFNKKHESVKRNLRVRTDPRTPKRRDGQEPFPERFEKCLDIHAFVSYDDDLKSGPSRKETMTHSHVGEFAALAVAVFWTITALAFESASKKVGSLPVNWLRLLIGFIFLSVFTLFERGLLFPVDAAPRTWFWLMCSGMVGFVMGDLFLFRAFVLIGSRIAMLIMALAPPMTALMGRIFLHEKMSRLSLLGMGLTLLGIALVVLDRPTAEAPIKLTHPLTGILLAFGGAVGQASGLILSKIGMGAYNPFAATQIRILAGILGFTLILTLMKSWPRTFAAVRHGSAMARLTAGAFFGPFLGVSFSLIAIQHTKTGIASTIMSTVPILIIPPSVIFLREKITGREIAGALFAVTGVALLFF
jgi:drug/metabolite transporter (DMT)-like permease